MVEKINGSFRINWIGLATVLLMVLIPTIIGIVHDKLILSEIKATLRYTEISTEKIESCIMKNTEDVSKLKIEISGLDQTVDRHSEEIKELKGITLKIRQ